MNEDSKMNTQMASAKNPWRFLTALDGDDETDRELVALTRGDEIQIISNMVAASRVSLLYAFSGNGKTSLINAGLIPFFNENGYAVFKMRPRPPWSIENPTQAFKDSILREVKLPLFRGSDLEILQAARDQLKRLPEARTKEIENLMKRLESKLRDSSETAIDNGDVSAYLRNYLDKPLVELISHIQSMLDPENRILFICDQFEELFVHYGNTPEMREFVSQLGEVWAENSLRVHLLFSMREDWVGSMIEFRRAIPDIFNNYFKLNPIPCSRAGDILTVPLKSVGMSFETKAVDRILADLVQVYLINQRERFAEVKLTPSPQDDPFIELPAIQVLADKLWETSNTVKKPFTLEHYQTLKNIVKEKQDEKAFPTVQKDNSGNLSSPTQVVLDNYMTDLLNNTPGSDKLFSREWRELRIDCLYLLTDKTSHRRALPENILLEEVKQIRPQGLKLPEVNQTLLDEAIEPLVKIRLVREEVTKDGHKQYELAHDFTVRSAVKKWRELDHKRTAEQAILNRERQEKEETYAELEQSHRRILRFLQAAPAIGIVMLAISAFSAGNLNYDENLYEKSALLSIGVITPFVMTLIVGLLKRHTWSILLGGLFSAVSSGYVLVTDDDFALTVLAISSIFLLLIYFRSSFDISLLLKSPHLIQRIFATLWGEFILMIETAVAVFIGFLGFKIFEWGGTGDMMANVAGIVVIFFAVTALFYLNARRIFKNGYPFFCKWTRLKLKMIDGSFLSISRSIARQFFFLLWLAVTIGLVIIIALVLDIQLTLWIGLFLAFWIAGASIILKVTKKQRHIYDLLTGCYPSFPDKTLEDIKGRLTLSRPKTGMTLLISPGARILFGAGIGGLGISYLLNPRYSLFLQLIAKQYGIYKMPYESIISYIVGPIMILASIGLLTRKKEHIAALITCITFGILIILKFTWMITL